MIIACSRGGTSIEDLAEKHPDLIIRVNVDINEGITDAQAAKVVEGLQPKVTDHESAKEQIKKLYKMFSEADTTLVEVSRQLALGLDWVISNH